MVELVGNGDGVGGYETAVVGDDVGVAEPEAEAVGLAVVPFDAVGDGLGDAVGAAVVDVDEWCETPSAIPRIAPAPRTPSATPPRLAPPPPALG